MPTLAVSVSEAALSAHAETSHPHVDVPTLLVVLVAVFLVVVVANLAPVRQHVTPSSSPETASWWGDLTLARRLVRTVSVVILVLVVVAGRIGKDDELENVAAALTIGAGWPLLVAGSLVVGTLWRWVDPWDALARALIRGDRSRPAAHVWPAVLLTLPWLWFLGAYPRPFDPRAVGAALAAYSVVTVAGCVALGRVRWLSSAEPLGLLLSWIGLLPRRRLSSWEPPGGAAALLGSVIGGLLFGLVRRTELWSGFAVRSDSLLWATVGVLGGCTLGITIAVIAALPGSLDHRAAVTQALVPVAAGVVLAVALARNRLFTSVQLLPGLVGDPLGRGWDVFGSPTAGLDTAPLGAAGLVAVQLGVVAAAHLLAAASAPRTLVGDERLSTIVVLAVSCSAALWALSLH